MCRYRRCYEVIYVQFVNVFFGYDPAVLYIRARYGRLIMVVKRDLIFRLKICWPIQSNDDIMLLYKLRDINSITGINFFYKYWHYVYPSNSIFVNKSVLIKRIISKSIATAYLEQKIKKYNFVNNGYKLMLPTHEHLFSESYLSSIAPTFPLYYEKIIRA